MQNITLPVDDIALHCEVRGEGPSLLMISGAGGDAGFYAAAAEELASSFRIISYDRRGNSRSTGADGAPMSMAQQAADAKAVIDGLAGGKALVFGNSLGALIALQLAAQSPDAAIAIIAHEPPAIHVLPDRDQWTAMFESVSATYAAQGGMAAVMQFVQTVRGEGTYAWPEDLMQRFMGNIDHLFGSEWPSIQNHAPDLAALKATTVPILLSAGLADRGDYYARPAVEIAQAIGAPWAEFPGLHMEAVANPPMFAVALRAVASELYTRVTGSVPSAWNTAAAG